MSLSTIIPSRPHLLPSRFARLATVLALTILLFILLPAAILAQSDAPVADLGVDPADVSGHNCGGVVNPDRASFGLDPNGPFSVLDLGGDANAPLAQCDVGCYKGHIGVLYRGENSVYTLTVRNEGAVYVHAPLVVTDTLPVGLKYGGFEGSGWTCRLITGQSEGGEVVCEYKNDLQVGEERSVRVYVTVEQTATALITNRARISVYGDLNPNNDEAQVPADVYYRADLGDAPDSLDNHFGLTNTAYAGVPGRFPTVWDLPASAPASAASGPLHQDPRMAWLGLRVTIEPEADRGPDQDMGNNILNGGADVADQDQGDDGWLNREMAFQDCREASLTVRVAKQPNAQPGRLYLNVWFDGNRDGDWSDAKSCPPPVTGGQTFASEWIVRDHLIDTSLITAGFQDFTVPTGLVMDDKLGEQAWVRFTLSEQKAVWVQGQNYGDGRGPRHPAVFALGETEDYLHLPGDQPQIELHKSLLANQNGETAQLLDYTVLPGEELFYSLDLANLDQKFYQVLITDTLPTGVIATGVTTQNGAASIVDDGRKVIWRTDLGGNTEATSMRLLIRAKVSDQVGCDDILINRAIWSSQGAIGTSNPVTVMLACRDLGDAPDSTNHFSATGSGTMTVEGGLPARFPTVADGPGAPGPYHRLALPFHLGRAVSLESEADTGPDTDGANNIQPPINLADQDRHDDGLDLASASFTHCKPGALKVQIFISPLALTLLAETEKVGYLNIWLDSNRNGSWGDVDACGLGGPSLFDTPEHIVIDHPVDAVTLGPGLHTLVIPTSGPVSWPAERADSSAWLRVSLSERPSEKGVGGYGDGHGPLGGFLLGETEDYLILPVDQRQPDLVVRKQGRILPQLGSVVSAGEDGGGVWRIRWIVDYANVGSADAVNVHVADKFEVPQSLVSERSVPAFPATQPAAQYLDYTLGTLGVGKTGVILISTHVIASTTPPGTILTNTVRITSDTPDANPNDNLRTVTLTVPLLPPVITYPIPGTVCDGMLKVVGRAYPNTNVDIYINSFLAGTAKADGLGHWAYDGYFTDGDNTLYAVARFGGLTSSPSPTVLVKVDHSLSWSPMSLTFSDPAGSARTPKGPDGRTDATGWQIFLRPGQTYTVSVTLCCGAGDGVVALTLTDGSEIPLTDPDKDSVYTGVFTTSTDKPVSGSMKLCVTCAKIKICSDGTVLIDPEGVIYDLTTGKPIPLSVATCFQAQSDGTGVGGAAIFSQWAAADFGQINPQTTGDDGYFSFFTPAGTFRVEAWGQGYQPYRTEDLVVVDTPVERNIPLTPLVEKKADYVISVGPNGFDPAVLTVPAGSIIEWVNVDSGEHTSTSFTLNPTASRAEANAPTFAPMASWDSGLLAGGESYKHQLDTVDTYTYADGASPIHQATIIVTQAQPAQNLVYLPLVRR